MNIQFDENIMLVGGTEAKQASVLLSIMCSYRQGMQNLRRLGHVEVWGHRRACLLHKYGEQLEEMATIVTDISEICEAVKQIKTNIMHLKEDDNEDTGMNRLVIIAGYENILGDSERLADESQGDKDRGEDEPFLWKAIDEAEKLPAGERAKVFAEYERKREEWEARHSKKQVYDIEDDLKWLLRNASEYGVHFIICSPTSRDFLKLKLETRLFRHKILFTIPKDDAYELTGSRYASTIAEDVCMYQGDIHTYSMRPHLHEGIVLNGWSIDEEGQAVQCE